MAGRERRSMMTGAQAAHCGSVSAISLGLPVSTAIPEAKGTLPKALFVGKAPISGKLKQRLVNEIESITMLALAGRPTPGLADGKLIPEVLVIGLKLTAKATRHTERSHRPDRRTAQIGHRIRVRTRRAVRGQHA